MNEIETIASKHLGKAGDGSVVKPYITPDSIDASLLVAIPRNLNRTQYEITDETLMYGFDTWNAYEVSFLLLNGFPVNCVAKITYSSKSPFIVESKSLKLYLNSFNMHRFSGNVKAAITEATSIIKSDLSDILKTDVAVSLFDTASYSRSSYFFNHERIGFGILERNVDYQNMTFDSFMEDPALLKYAPINPNGKYSVAVTTSSLRSNCRVTNQPDWGDVFIYMNGKAGPTEESLLKYIISMRKENHFHEEICECIYKRLLDKFEPDDMMVACLYTRRGGIDINPVRATSMDLIIEFAEPMIEPGVRLDKTMRQ